MHEIRIPLGDLNLAALVHGAQDAPPVLALHGWLDNAASFAPLSAHLKGRRLIALDMPGHGHSDHLPHSPGVHYHFADSVQVVLSAADALGLDSFALLGHSMGAGIGSLVAAAAPERISHLALIEGLGPLADTPDTTLKRFRDAVTPPVHPRNRRLRVFADIDSAALARSRASGLPPDLARPIIERALRPVDGGFSWRADSRLTEPSPIRMAEQQVHRLLAGIACPAWLLLAQPETPYLPAAMIAARADCLADIRIEHMAGHHHLHLEHPDAVCRQLSSFLGGP
ncbi:MAG: alpha/beta hydrolase [Rhodanobacteraceae bacterium]